MTEANDLPDPVFAGALDPGEYNLRLYVAGQTPKSLAAIANLKRVCEDHLAGREYIVGDDYTIADISLWGWIDRAGRVLAGEAEPLARFPNIRRWFEAVNGRPAVARARAVGKNHTFKREFDEETKRALFPSNYPPVEA